MNAGNVMPQLPANVAQAAMPPVMPPVPNMADVQKMQQIYNWFTSSGLTAEEIERLAEMKKNGTDVRKLLNIPEPVTVEGLANKLDKLADAVAALAGKVNEINNMKEKEAV